MSDERDDEEGTQDVPDRPEVAGDDGEPGAHAAASAGGDPLSTPPGATGTLGSEQGAGAAKAQHDDEDSAPPAPPPAQGDAAGSTTADPGRRNALIAGGTVAGFLVVALLAWALTRDSGDEVGGPGTGTPPTTAFVPTTAAITTTVAPAVVPSAPPATITPVATVAPPPTAATITPVATVAPPPTAAGIPGLPTFPPDSTTPPVPSTVGPTIAPSVPATAAASAVTVPATAAGVSTTAPGAVPSSVASSTPNTAAAAALVAGSVVPDVAAFTQSLTPSQERAETLALAAAARHDIAVTGPVRTLCAVVRLSGPIELAGRWERNGREVETIGASRVGAPGLGDCLDDDDGDPLPDGTYQFLVRDGDGNESAAGTVVVGAARVDQALVNDGTADICAVRVAPTAAGYYDAYSFDSAPIVAGATVTLALAAVDQDAQVTSCGAEPETLASFEFTPDPSSPQSLTGPT